MHLFDHICEHNTYNEYHYIEKVYSFFDFNLLCFCSALWSTRVHLCPFPLLDNNSITRLCPNSCFSN